MKIPHITRVVLCFALFILPCEVLLADIQVNAVVQPQEITLEEAAQLDVTIEGSANVAAPKLPDVDGLEFHYVGPSTQVQIINFQMSSNVIHRYQVIPRKLGHFTIPAIRVVVDGKVMDTRPLQLRAIKSFSANPSPPTSQTNPSIGQGTPGEPAAPSAEVAFVQLVYPKREFYVGELVPIQLKVYLRQGLQISEISAPSLSGSAFTVTKLTGKPSERREIIQGQRYTVLTWQPAITAVKAGDHPLGAKIQCALLVRSRTHHPSFPFGGGLLDDDFLESFFGTVQQKQVTLQSQEATVKILSLPSEGRPADFGGAVGKFELSTAAVPTEVVIGDPVTLKMIVSGSGNFDRVSSPTLESTTGWKTYTPTEKFEPADEVGYGGQKMFEQAIIPQQADIQNIPLVRFSYFDPSTRKYAMLLSSSIPIRLTASPTGSMVASQFQPSSSQRGSNTVFTSSAGSGGLSSSSQAVAEELVPNKVEFGKRVTALRPAIFSSWFVGIQSIPLLTLAVCWAIARRRERLSRNPALARAIAVSRAVRVHLTAMEKALRNRHAQVFFEAARRALQQRLSERSGVKAETITLSEIEGHLLHDPTLIESVRKIFETADAVVYSGQVFSDEALSDWKRTILDALNKLEKKR